MIRPIRRLAGSLMLGCVLALAGAQAIQQVTPIRVHAAAARETGPVLAGTWLNFQPGARFSDLQVSASTTSHIGGAPFAVNYSLYVFSVSANRFEAFGIAAPVPFNAADTVTIPLTALPTPSRFFSTTVTLSLIDNGLTAQPTLRVAIYDHSRIFGDRFSVEIMHR